MRGGGGTGGVQGEKGSMRARDWSRAWDWRLAVKREGW